MVFRQSFVKNVLWRFSHCLNLALSKACSVPIVRNCLGIVTELVGFFSHSAKRTRILETVVDEMQTGNSLPPTRVRRLKHLCETRWVERHESLSALVELFPAVIQCLTDMRTDGNAATSKNAASLLRNLGNSSTLIGLAVAEHMSALLLPLITLLLSKSIDSITCCKEVDAILSVLRYFRTSDDTFSRIFASAQYLCSHLGLELVIPRITSHQTHRTNINVDEVNAQESVESSTVSPVETYYRISVINPFVDFLVTQLTDRFTSHRSNAFLLQAFVPDYCSSYSVEDLVPVFEMYGDILPGGRSVPEAEFELWKCKSAASASTHSLKPCNAFDAYGQCPEYYPNIKLLLKILSTLPVTTASAERSFSMLRRLKSWLRSTMSDDRLTGLALLAVSRDIIISAESVIDIILSKKNDE